MKIRREGDTLRSTTKTNLICLGISLGAGLIGFLALFFELSYVIGFVGAILGVYGLWLTLKLWLDRIEMLPDALKIRFNFENKTIQKSEISSITRAKGVGVILNMKDGSKIIAPDMNNAMSVVNVLKAWFRKGSKK